jgi:hypothetical protein
MKHKFYIFMVAAASTCAALLSIMRPAMPAVGKIDSLCKLSPLPGQEAEKPDFRFLI